MHDHIGEIHDGTRRQEEVRTDNAIDREPIEHSPDLDLEILDCQLANSELFYLPRIHKFRSTNPSNLSDDIRRAWLETQWHECIGGKDRTCGPRIDENEIDIQGLVTESDGCTDERQAAIEPNSHPTPRIPSQRISSISRFSRLVCKTKSSR